MEGSVVVMTGLCFLVGLSLGLLGGGGTILTVPIFVYAGGMAAEEAIAASLVIVGAVSVIGAVHYFKKGFVNRRLALLFVLSGMPSAVAGAALTSRVAPEMLLLLFGTLMCLVAVILFLKSGRAGGAAGVPVCRPGIPLSLSAGAAIGFLTGFLGVGGGFLIVPAIAVLMRCSLHTAVGTSLAVIAVNSLTGFTAHLSGFRVPPLLLAGIFTVMLAGTLLGSRAALRLSGSAMQHGFAGVIFITGIFVILRNLPAF